MKDSSADANRALNRAKIAQHDEFMTQEVDVKNEVLCSGIYDGCFNGKIVLCNCNDMYRSGFSLFFEKAFSGLGLKELITVSYKPEGKAKAMRFDGKTKKCVQLTGTGDYQSAECIALLDECDIVCTNPPFSIFRNFVKTVIEHGKQFLLIGNINEMTCKDMFPLFKDNEIWYGKNQVKTFDTLEGERKFGNIGWYTNMGKVPEPKPIVMTKSYGQSINPQEEYPKYDNYPAIDVNRIAKIPYDYFGEMGVPGTYLLQHNPDVFEIIGTSGMLAGEEELPDGTVKRNPGRFYINGRRLYDRVVIKRK